MPKRTVSITATQKFLHGDGRYSKGRTYDVSPELAAYFVGVGWATSDDVPESAYTTIPPTLDVSSSDHHHTAKN